jgi:hypothetical protein
MKVGAASNAIENTASVKSRIANLFMNALLLRCEDWKPDFLKNQQVRLREDQ